MDISAGLWEHVLKANAIYHLYYFQIKQNKTKLIIPALDTRSKQVMLPNDTLSWNQCSSLLYVCLHFYHIYIFIHRCYTICMHSGCLLVYNKLPQNIMPSNHFIIYYDISFSWMVIRTRLKDKYLPGNKVAVALPGWYLTLSEELLWGIEGTHILNIYIRRQNSRILKEGRKGMDLGGAFEVRCRENRQNIMIKSL